MLHDLPKNNWSRCKTRPPGTESALIAPDWLTNQTKKTCVSYVRSGRSTPIISHIIGDKLINPIVGVYIPIIRIPIKGGMTIPNIATFDDGTYVHIHTYEYTIDTDILHKRTSLNRLWHWQILAIVTIMAKNISPVRQVSLQTTNHFGTSAPAF